MIGRLRGVLAEVGEEDALIDVAGVGYVVRCGARTLSRLPAPGDEVLIHVESQFSAEQGPRLYGFLARDERRAFAVLQTVQGVGPKAALGVLDVLSPGELATAVARDDKAAVGRVIELKGKALGEVVFHPSVSGAMAAPAPVSQAGEAVSALMGLGIAEASARRAVDQVLLRLGEEAEVGAVIRGALQELDR